MLISLQMASFRLKSAVSRAERSTTSSILPPWSPCRKPPSARSRPPCRPAGPADSPELRRGAEFGLLFILMGLCYLGVLALADSVRLRMGVGAILALHLVFVIAPPLLSSDLFNYVGYARLQTVHGLNPYVHPLSAAPIDPSYVYVGWPLN